MATIIATMNMPRTHLERDQNITLMKKSCPVLFGGSRNIHCAVYVYDLVGMYRDRLKGVQILLSNSQAGPGRTVKQEQEEISRNHVQAF